MTISTSDEQTSMIYVNPLSLNPLTSIRTPSESHFFLWFSDLNLKKKSIFLKF